MPLCKNCEQFDPHSFAKDSNGRRGRQYSAVFEAAAAGCPFCSLLIQHVPVEDASPNLWLHFRLGESHRKYRTWDGQAGLQANRLWVKSGPRLPSINEDLYFGDFVKLYVAADPGSAAATSGDVTGRYLGEDQSSTAHFDTIEQWVRECRLEHPTCCRTASGRVEIDSTDVDLPSRCIEITKKHIKLKEGESHTVGWRGKYIALSHRWTDDTEDSKTTTQNVEDRKQGLCLNDLPKVVEDAIEVAKRLSIPYLWVDSLCIIQSGDNGDDWKREARKMASYYQQAYVVLAGTAASKDDGLFIPRLHNHPTHIAQLPYRDKAGVRRGYLYVYSRENSATSEYHNGVRNTELSERVFFECQTLLPRNTDQELIDADVTESDSDVALTMNIRTKFNASNVKPAQLWYQIIEAYSKLKLKYPQKDRVLAMQGVATEFRDMVLESQRKATPDTGVQDANSSPLYLAGLWLHDIHYGLLWQQKSVAPASEKLSSLPSWSWASRLSEVFWPSFPEHAGPPINACRLIGVVIEGISYPIETNFNALLEIAHLCDVDRASAGLLVSGRLQPVMVRGFLKTTQVLDRMSKSTGDVDTSHLQARETWRAVYSLSSTGFVSGWGSFEGGDIQTRLEALPDAGAIIMALNVSSTNGLLPGLTMGQLSLWSKVHNVLYLERVQGRQCRRVGVGRVFEKDLMVEFDTCDEEVIELV